MQYNEEKTIETKVYLKGLSFEASEEDTLIISKIKKLAEEIQKNSLFSST